MISSIRVRDPAIKKWPLSAHKQRLLSLMLYNVQKSFVLIRKVIQNLTTGGGGGRGGILKWDLKKSEIIHKLSSNYSSAPERVQITQNV